MPNESKWTDGMIRRPEADYMDAAEFRKLFTISAELLDEYIRNEVIPEPLKLTPRTVVFTWKHAVILAYRMELKWFPTAMAPPDQAKAKKTSEER